MILSIETYSESFDTANDLASEHIAVLERLLDVSDKRLNFREHWTLTGESECDLAAHFGRR